MIAVRDIVNRSLVVLCAVVALGAPASAQVTDVEPYLAVVTRDASPMRCGDMDRFYKVAELKAGAVVRVVGESRAWAQVEYPSSMTAFVRNDEASASGDLITLTRASKLRAANLAGPSGSWKPLLKERLDEGATLTLVETVTGRDGSVFYRVAAPKGALGYLQLAHVRRASDDEAAAFEAASGAPTKTEEPSITEAPAVETPTQVAAEDATPEPGIVGPEGDETAAVEQAEAAALETGGVDAPVTAIAQEPVERPLMTFDEVEAAFTTVLAEDVMHAEFEELISEINRLIASLDDSDMNTALRDRLDRRVAWLTLRADYQESLRDLDEREARISADRADLEEQISRLRNESEFSYVGRLSASSIYDGRRMPLLYRLESAGKSPRTLGYIRPDEQQAISNKLGLLVGIIGTSTQDTTSELLIINPERVVVLNKNTPPGN